MGGLNQNETLPVARSGVLVRQTTATGQVGPVRDSCRRRMGEAEDLACTAQASAGLRYRRREPERTLLHATVRAHPKTFLAEMEAARRRCRSTRIRHFRVRAVPRLRHPRPRLRSRALFFLRQRDVGRLAPAHLDRQANRSRSWPGTRRARAPHEERRPGAREPGSQLTNGSGQLVSSGNATPLFVSGARADRRSRSAGGTRRESDPRRHSPPRNRLAPDRRACGMGVCRRACRPP